MTKTGCRNALPTIIKKIIHPKTVDKIVNFIRGEAITDPNVGLLVDNSADFCNKIIPAVSKYFQENGLSHGVGDEVNKLIGNYLDTSLSIFKNILWDVLQNTASKAIKTDSSVYIDEVFGNREIIYSLADENKRKIFDEIFNQSSINIVANNLAEKAEEVYSVIEKNIDQTKVNQIVQELNTGQISQEINEEENNMKQNLRELMEDKITIGDFTKDLTGTISKCMILWKKEVNKHRFDNDYSNLDCLLNVIDLRINTLTMEICTIFAKGLLPDKICNEKFYELIKIFYDKPIEEITKEDLLNTTKNIIIDSMVEIVKNKVIQYKDIIEDISNQLYASLFGYHCIV